MTTALQKNGRFQVWGRKCFKFISYIPDKKEAIREYYGLVKRTQPTWKAPLANMETIWEPVVKHIYISIHEFIYKEWLKKQTNWSPLGDLANYFIILKTYLKSKSQMLFFLFLSINQRESISNKNYQMRYLPIKTVHLKNKKYLQHWHIVILI